MDKAVIEITKAEAEVIANYLPGVRLQNVTVANAPEAMKIHILVGGIIEKIQKAFVVEPQPAEAKEGEIPQPAPQQNKSQRKRH
jgi:hypothetical protein